MKRVFDLTVSLLLLIVLSPVMGVTALCVRKYLGSPVLFRQCRPGLHMRPFHILKFRTMTDKRDENGSLLSDSERLTSFGAFLRKTSLDELPQLINVIKGEMSLVGPRPLLLRYLPFYTETEKKRFLVRPGITGLAQISGRNRLTWDERLHLDVKYVERQSLALDLTIMWKSVIQVLERDGFEEVTERQLPDLDVERLTIPSSVALSGGITVNGTR
ncbi:sugar transferase [Paenibacillus sp. GYB003]|uniref:sugar transferase n=1 Tax=Paenibacillus sp. GYB003 TaxID=2994392 RepID=UPI002F9616E8